MTDREKIWRKASELGFAAMGVSRAEALGPEGERLRLWLERGYHATMSWMQRTADRRQDPLAVLSRARSVISLAMNYYSPERHPGSPGKISRYAWGDDYHSILESRMGELLRWMALEFPGAEGRAAVDSGPFMDKAWAVRSGIGWLGKHTNVITRHHGSWVFLGEILTSVELEPDTPATDLCGSCTRCIDACPTEAIVEPYVVDSRRCLSYLTIEHRGEIDAELLPQFDGWVFGCDVCQDVCPWNLKFARPTAEPGFRPREGFVDPPLEKWEGMTAEEFDETFRKSPVRRTKHAGLQRNIGIVRSADTNGSSEASHA
jgi:epoxyqueuosine reductase